MNVYLLIKKSDVRLGTDLMESALNFVCPPLCFNREIFSLDIASPVVYYF